MLSKNVEKILSLLAPSDIVLDIGGWAQPFARANYVLDVMPYETRGFYEKIGLPAKVGGQEEFFSKSTWIQRDICARDPYPFKDKSIDFVICSHTLEDVRDPLWVCSEMVRIAKRGYIEVPSRFSESTEDYKTGLAGCSHHRWLAEIDRNHVCFEMKYHQIHQKGNHFPAYFRARMKPEEAAVFLFWEKSFDFSEAPMALSDGEIESRLKAFLKNNRPSVGLLEKKYAQLKAWGIRHGYSRPVFGKKEKVK